MLLAVGAVATIATSRLPELTQRLFAIPVGVALIGLGYSLWREQRTAERPAASPVSSTARPDRRQVTIHPAASPLGRPGRRGRPGGCTSRWSPSSSSRHRRLAAAGRTGRRSAPPAREPSATVSPVPLVVHIVSALAYAVLGAFQFSAALRRRRPGWHRAAGRVLVVLGLAVAFSALCLTLFYPRQPGTGVLAYVFRLAFGSGMAVSIVLGFAAIRRGDVSRHRAWMTRAYALALGAGTQVFTKGIGPAVFGTSELTTDVSLGAGWVINLAVAEYVIRRAARRPHQPSHRHQSDREGRILMTPATKDRRLPPTTFGSMGTWTSTGRPGSVTSP